ncbi:hypothetical protein [Lacibacter sp.]|uniref:hypothetical protein n=1 Tax=Lacibacter sp. TaxID=1915409 RepID=UPI002B4AE7BD|nr:hypothetical protein [Lacibacter sp.]HLP36881.1 hypothetical protein [Lacibacter sp.]
MEENKSIHNEEEAKPPSNERQLNNSSTDEPIAESDQPVTHNPQPVTQPDMEVHHHAHDPAAPHHKKNWKSYFWEFLMLFLAVFCGFLAEYQLEHKIEAERAKKYMYDMVENLKYDTIRYNRNLRNNEILGKQLDTFRAEISQAVKGQIDGNRLYELWIKTANFNSVVYNRTALTQLKNSGSFRLIKNDKLSSSISDYYERKISASEEQEEKLRRLSERLSVTSAQFFYYEALEEMLSTETIFKEMTPDSIAKRLDKVLHSDLPLTLLNSNPADLKLLYNDVAMKEDAMKKYNAFLRWSKEAAIALMMEIKEEYQFEK